MDGSIVSHPTPKTKNINIAPGRLFASIRATKFTRIERDGCDQFLPFKQGDNWWSVEQVTGPEFVLRLYGAQLALDFFEYVGDGGSHEGSPISGLLGCVLQSMPAEKGPIELGFIDQVFRFACASTIVPKGGAQ